MQYDVIFEIILCRALAKFQQFRFMMKCFQYNNNDKTCPHILLNPTEHLQCAFTKFLTFLKFPVFLCTGQFRFLPYYLHDFILNFHAVGLLIFGRDSGTNHFVIDLRNTLDVIRKYGRRTTRTLSGQPGFLGMRALR